MVEECEGRGERFEMLGDDRTADLDHSELLRGHGAEMRKILLNFALGANVTEQLNDSRASRETICSGRRVLTSG